ncbi:MAG: hypothetical protein ACKO5Q_24285, partial [Microcystaceae cyanobacterium]
DWESIWQEVVNQLGTVPQLLCRYAYLANVCGNQVLLKVKTEPLLKIIRTKIPDIETAFRQVTGQNLTVKLIVAIEPTKH